MSIDYPVFTPQYCRELKEKGFPHPTELKEGQVWYSLLDIPYIIKYKSMNNGWVAEMMNTGKLKPCNTISGGMVYHPTETEFVSYYLANVAKKGTFTI